jgi:zinc protease
MVIVAAVAGCTFAAHPPPSPERNTNWSLPVDSLALANGLRVVVIHDPRAVEVQVTMRYQVGIVDDPPEQPGMAHLVAHLMYQQLLGAKSVFAHLEDGATFFNGVTTFDATTFISRAAPNHLDELLSIEAIRMGLRCTSITQPVFEREREVVVNELRLGGDRDVRATVYAALYSSSHPYARAADSEQSVRNITRDQACAFADAHYGPTNAVLVVSGDITAPQLEGPLAHAFGRIPKRDLAPPVVVPPAPASRRLEITAPIDDDLLVIAWPLPADPMERARVRALVPAVFGSIDNSIRGQVVQLELGDMRAMMIGVVASAGDGESFAEMVTKVKQAIELAPAGFRIGRVGSMVLDQVKQSAIYDLYTALEDGSDRDVRVAADALAGLVPGRAILAAHRGVNELTLHEALTLASESFSLSRATILTVKSSAAKKRGQATSLATPIHVQGQRRDPPDPADAHRAAGDTVPAPRLDGMRTRRLANGMKIVLLPVTSVPTVDIRLVFGSGSADEPASKRGTALVAANTLSWNFHHVEDAIRFLRAGGSVGVDLGVDHTAFSVRGLDMHLDYLLAGLRRWVRDGTYKLYAHRAVEAIRRQIKVSDDIGALTDAFRAAIYGADHPYVAAGLARHASPSLNAGDAEQFRGARYTPDNATLVIAGRFDANLADRWIDYLFADWEGHAEVRSSPRATSQPAAIAKVDDTSVASVRIGLPATAGDRAAQLVAAAMLNEIARDVRHQLGASYTFDAALAERRLATTYMIVGSVDATRMRDAIELLAARIAQLRSDEVATARAFVAARSRVLTQLGSSARNADALASRVQADVAMGRPALSDPPLAAAVRALTIEQMTAALGDLDLPRAVVSMRGPRAELDAAFTALGRTPTYVRADAAAPPLPPAAEPIEEKVSESEFEDALSEQPQPIRLTVVPGFTAARVDGQDATGLTVTGAIARGFDATTSFGLSLTVGRLDSRYIPDPINPEKLAPSTIIPIEADIFVQAIAYDHLWGSLFGGLHLERRNEGTAYWNVGLGVGLEAGVDAIRFGRNRIGLFTRVEGVLATGYGALTFGLAYRH